MGHWLFLCLKVVWGLGLAGTGVEENNGKGVLGGKIKGGQFSVIVSFFAPLHLM
jgi:hypothetical protein